MLTAEQLKRAVDMMKLEHSLHKVICGRTRKNIRLIEANSKTAIYFPPPFPRIYGYLPKDAHRRGEDEIFISGETQDNINQAKIKLRELLGSTKCYMKEVMLSASKIDSILLDRLDKVRKVMELNGSYVMFPPLGSQRTRVQVQGTEILHVERTVREIMALVCSWSTSKRSSADNLRPANSIARLGGLFNRMRSKPLVLQDLATFELCFLTCAQTRELISRSKSFSSQSMVRTTLSKTPWS